MTRSVFDFPFHEHHTRVLSVSSLVSILFHGILLIALAFALPMHSMKQPEEEGVSIDLELLETPPMPKMAASASPPAAETGDEPVASEPESAPLPPSETEPKPETATAKAVAMPTSPPVHKRIESKKPEEKKVNKKFEAKKTEVRKEVKGKEFDASQKPVASRSSGVVQGAPASKNATPMQTASKMPPALSSAPSPIGGSRLPKPSYPEGARKRRQEGTVNVRCMVDANGYVTSCTLAKSSGFKLLDEEALRTVKKWKFNPARKNGASVAGTVVVPVQFRLR